MELEDKYTEETGDSSFRYEDANGIIAYSEEFVEWLKPTLFKVATEDSCEVLVEPKYEDCKQYDNPHRTYEGRVRAYDKAPLISQDRLELNKLRVENERLNKVILNHLEIESSNGRTFKSMSSKLTETNKQLKEYKEVVDEIKKIDRFEMEAGLGYNEGLVYEEKESEGTWIKFETVDELLSKLNKD
jgi:hypothetical protein